MDLSNDLISQFAKLTTGDKDKNKENTVYGTVTIYDGKTCVKIDGSDLLTPVDTTTEVKEGERVAILIKNHSAVIMGNTSDPSAGTSTTDGITENLTKVTADVGEFKELTAENFKATNAEIENLTAKNAEIENLVADKATIGQLEAVEAKIKDLDVGHLEAEIAEINEAMIDKANIADLNATNATINDLKASKADIADLNALDAEINNLSSNFATIQQLDATNANINTLDAEVADIQTLVNGNLTSDNIASLNLTASNTTVANAFIKDAMIDSVTASKLTAGIIDTSAISIKSKDGSMLITGSVQQFKDDNGKVRIQIGKDGGGKFTFILYNESGTGVLIDESGIKSSEAIADGLIVDAKVAKHANISGSKLDIASVITEVNNDDSTTIKSNKIYLDEQGQSLEVAFNSLKTQVETIQDVTIDGDLSSVIEQVQSNTTQINVNKSEISTLVSQNEIRKEEIKNLDDEIVEVSTDINSKYTSLQQDLSGFKTTVGETYTTKTDFNNLNNNLKNNYSTTSAMNSAINQKANEITSSVSQTYATKQSVTDVSNNLTNNYSTTSAMNSAINQKANEITSSVSETYTTKSEFNNLNVGGTNLLPNSKTLSGWISQGELINSQYDGTFKAVRMLYEDTSGYKEALYKSRFLKLEPNTQYTLSFWARGNGTFYSYLNRSGIAVVSKGYNSSGHTTTSPDGSIRTTLTNNDVFTRYWITWMTSNSITKDTLLTLVVARTAAELGRCTMELCGIKLEKGNKATDWSPAPEDIQGEIDAVSNNLTTNYSTTSQMNSAINQKANEITSSVSQTYATKSEFNNLNVGGRNLLSVPNETNVYSSNGESGKTKDTFTMATNIIPTGTEYIVSFEAKSSANMTCKCYFYSPNTTLTSESSTGGKFTGVSDGECYVDITTSWKRYWVKWTQTAANAKKHVIVGRNETAGVTLEIRAVKFEEGNKPTAWSPAPELATNSINDLSNNLKNNYSTTSAMNSAINQKANEITSSVSQTYATKQSVTDVSNNLTNNYSTTSAMNSAINQKANEITSSVSETYTTKSEFNNLNVGGRNLLSVPNETNVYSSNGESGTFKDTFAMPTNIIPTGNEYIVSFEAKSSANMTCKCFFYLPNTTLTSESSTGYKGTGVADGTCYVNITTSWKRYWVKWTQTAANAQKHVIVGRNETAGVTLEIRAVKFEEGNKPTAWSPAPELTTNSIDNLTTRMQNAESKLTKDSLTTTIGDYYTTESKISSYGYATTSQVTQTKNDLTATFKSIGGYNLIKNSCGYGGTRGWSGNASISYVYPASHARSVGFNAILYIWNNDTSERFTHTPRFKLKQNTTYTLSGYIWKNSNVSSYEVHVLSSTSASESDTGTSYTNALLAHTGTAQTPTYFEKTFTTASNIISGVVRIDHNGYNNNGNTVNCNVHFTGLCLVEGSVAKPWSPHPSETYSATTIVDANGVKVTHSDAVGYTQMGASGFYLNDGSKNVLSVTSSGANFNMPVNADLITTGTLNASKVTVSNLNASNITTGTINASNIKITNLNADNITTGTINASKIAITNLNASNITTGTLSGNLIKGGKISASEEIGFVGGARIFGTGGEAGARLTISASEYSLSGASKGFLGGSWSIDENLTVAGTTKSKTLNVTSTSTLSGGVSCNSTLSVSGASTLTGAVSMGGNLKVAGTLELNNFSIWLGTRNETVTAAAIKFGTGGYLAAYSGFHLVQSNGNAHSLRAGTIYTNGTQVTSDRRKKMDIRYVNVDKQSIGDSGRMAPNTNITIQDMHEFIGSLPLTSFRYIEEVEDNRNLTHYGFLTQDIMYTKVGSELVTMLDESKRIGDDEDYTGYSVEKLLMFVCGALQEEIHQRQLLEKEIKNLKEGK